MCLSTVVNYFAETFKPIIETKSSKRKNKRLMDAGSFKRKIPTMDAPKAPIPTQIAYAVPIGSTWLAFASKNILADKQTIVNMLGTSLVKPSVYLSPMAQQTSRIPAIDRITQAKLVDMEPLLVKRAVFTIPGTVHLVRYIKYRSYLPFCKWVRVGN